MKKRIISLCMSIVVTLFMVCVVFASTSTDLKNESSQINSETEQFLYGDWKVKSILGSQMNTKNHVEYHEGDKILGKVVEIAPNLFSTSDFAPEYENCVVNISNVQYKVKDSLTGNEFTSKYKVSEEIIKIKDDDQIKVIQVVSEDKNDTNIQQMLIVVNTERLLICLNNEYFELGKNFWSENDMNVAIYDPYVSDDGFYHVEYLNNEAEMVSEEDSIRLLMINGGVVPYPDIKVINNRMLVPLKVFSEQMGAKVDWDEENKTIDITEDKTKIRLTINNHKASINNNIKTIDATPVILDGKIYVPVRFVAEALSADVQYISEFSKYEDWKKKTVNSVSVVTIEKPNKKAKVYSIEEGLMKVKETSVEEYNALLIFLKEGNRTFDDICKDYAAQDIVYTNQTVGRYYVYRLEAFPDFNIYFNKYTGEIYSECSGLPFLSISKAFINISWMYQ